MATWSDFFRSLMTPSAHEGDPCLEATNQFGHMALGAVMCLAGCIGWFVFAGEMPVRVWVWCSVVIGYAVIIEAILQGWKGRDSFADTWFVQCGATMSMWPVYEVMMGDGSTTVIEFKPKLLGILMVIAFASLAIHLWPRIKRYVSVH